MNDGYDNPDALVETDWLAEHLDDPTVVVLDATYFLPHMARNAREEYRAAHIPGARFFDIDAVSDKTTDLPHMLPSAEDFAAAVGALGIGNTTQAVVYDSFGLMSAARVWWTFRVFGHDKVAVLNGGMPKWKAEGRPLSDSEPQVRPANFSASLRPELVTAIGQIRQRVETEAPNIIDARAADRFSGTAAELWPGRRRGHIPGSRNLPFTDLLDPDSKTLIPAAAIRHRFADAGVDFSAGTQPVWTCSCGSGITACALALGGYLIGQTDMAIYDGSWAQWGLPGDTPVEPASANESAPAQ